MQVLRADPLLAPLIERHGPPRLRLGTNVYHALGRAIIFQQLSGSAANTIYRRFLALYPGGRFPAPDRLRATRLVRLRRAGLSRQKANYLRDLATKFGDGTLRPRRLRALGDLELRAALLEIKGVGHWTVDMLFLFTLGKPDVLPVADLGIRKGMQKLFDLDQLPDEEAMNALAERWRPYRSVASYYLWRVLEG